MFVRLIFTVLIYSLILKQLEARKKGKEDNLRIVGLSNCNLSIFFASFQS